MSSVESRSGEIKTISDGSEIDLSRYPGEKRSRRYNANWSLFPHVIETSKGEHGLKEIKTTHGDLEGKQPLGYEGDNSDPGDPKGNLFGELGGKASTFPVLNLSGREKSDHGRVNSGRTTSGGHKKDLVTRFLRRVRTFPVYPSQGNHSKREQPAGHERINFGNTFFDTVSQYCIRGDANLSGVDEIEGIFGRLAHNIMFNRSKADLESTRSVLENYIDHIDDIDDIGKESKYFIKELRALIGEDDSCLNNPTFELVAKGLKEVAKCRDGDDGQGFENNLFGILAGFKAEEAARIRNLFTRARGEEKI
jgi:hypothetical protein